MPTIKQRAEAAENAKPCHQNGADHFVEYVQQAGGHANQFRCICGWKSNEYWHLTHIAWDEWLVHAFETNTEIREVDKDRQAMAIKDRDDYVEFYNKFKR